MEAFRAGAKRQPLGARERANRLVFAVPTPNLEGGMLSAPYYPDWLDDDGTNDIEENKEEQNVEQKFGECEGAE